jgi:hypothetical protein
MQLLSLNSFIQTSLAGQHTEEIWGSQGNGDGDVVLADCDIG